MTSDPVEVNPKYIRAPKLYKTRSSALENPALGRAPLAGPTIFPDKHRAPVRRAKIDRINAVNLARQHRKAVQQGAFFISERRGNRMTRRRRYAVTLPPRIGHIFPNFGRRHTAGHRHRATRPRLQAPFTVPDM